MGGIARSWSRSEVRLSGMYSRSAPRDRIEEGCCRPAAHGPAAALDAALRSLRYCPPCPEDHVGALVLPEGLPCVVSLRVVESRLSKSFLAVDICSSEELAQQLATPGVSWSIFPLIWAHVRYPRLP